MRHSWAEGRTAQYAKSSVVQAMRLQQWRSALYAESSGLTTPVLRMGYGA